MVQRIIGAKTSYESPHQRRQNGPDAAVDAGAAREPARPEVSRVTIDDNAGGQRLDNFLLRWLKGVPKTHVYRVIRSGEVRVNKGRATADTRLAVGDEVRIPPVRTSLAAAERAAAPAAPAREFPIVFEDDQLIAVDKPAGVAVHGGSGVAFGVIEQLRRARPQARFLELVHRLDKETSGLLLVAKTRPALLALQEQLRQRETGKTYAALVLGVWPPSTRVIDVPLHKFLTADGERRVRTVLPPSNGHGNRNDPSADGIEGRRSITLVKLMRQYANHALLDVTIKTGRTHQIRVHLLHAGHPIAGDEKYGDFEANKALARGGVVAGVRFGRMFLHARRLRFQHPATGEAIELQSTLPPECTALLNALGASREPSTP